MKVEVLSVGGSLLFKNGKVNYSYIQDLKKFLSSFKDRKFVLVIGGGTVARTYIDALEKLGANRDTMSRFGIGITRTNARLIANVLGKDSNIRDIPKTLRHVKGYLRKHKIVCCGALRYEPNQTSDGTAAQIAHYLKTRFINVTNVKGLYTKDPNRFKGAKLVSKISYEEFSKLVNKLKYHPGQHFILDQHAAETIKKNRIKTFIVSGSFANLKNLLRGKKFVGTSIN
ncbi:UMP kinase [Candidatus Woesearchaeota archaeon]|jgi:uridylate kinase|nr:UMP kinase [Candidatus Woesearchaeota archaeon]MBT5215940.1 UMP kinase [Candidatus Woesearchaeota archaeon]MBT6402347.1 UMP kinase [Candidatus Woesearchaeota archaeon]